MGESHWLKKMDLWEQECAHYAMGAMIEENKEKKRKL